MSTTNDTITTTFEDIGFDEDERYNLFLDIFNITSQLHQCNKGLFSLTEEMLGSVSDRSLSAMLTIFVISNPTMTQACQDINTIASAIREKFGNDAKDLVTHLTVLEMKLKECVTTREVFEGIYTLMRMGYKRSLLTLLLFIITGVFLNASLSYNNGVD